MSPQSQPRLAPFAWTQGQRAGMAWHYKYYQSEQTAEDRKLYADAETE